jgi:hypothetical protein
VAHRVRCPLFVCIGEEDRVVPRRAAERTAERAPRGERGVYPIDHFGGFLGENFERVVADQIEFLSRRDRLNVPRDTSNRRARLLLCPEIRASQLSKVITVIREVLSRDGGFTHVHRATETPFNLILKARPQNDPGMTGLASLL